PKRSSIERLRCGLDARFVGYLDHRADPADKAFIRKCLKDYDLVWLHNLITPNAFNLWRWPNSVLDLDDVPSTYLLTIRQGAGKLSERFRAGFRCMVAKRRELLLLERFDIVAVCSEADKKYLGASERIHVIPNGFAQPIESPPRCLTNPPRIGFIG